VLNEQTRTLVIGIGNPIVQDDAIGIRLARDLQTRIGTRPDVEWCPECAAGGLDLLERLVGFGRVIALDAIRTRGGRPGDWYTFTAAALRETRHLSNVHDTNFATALELGRRLGLALAPDRDIHVFAIEILKNDTFGEELSPPVEAAYATLIDEIGTAVAGLLDSSPP
jgi:hydrogenase maturation protease